MGNTPARRPCTSTAAVHPHTHGEHRVNHFTSSVFAGSSPHAWGTRGHSTVSCYHRRFIPTRMGNTRPGRPGTAAGSVHPHTHGEHPLYWANTHLVVGSSPHAWGTRNCVTDFLFLGRFIPTRMGNTNTRAREYTPGPVHPHTHGEHRSRARYSSMAVGSSPHAWGTLGTIRKSS